MPRPSELQDRRALDSIEPPEPAQAPPERERRQPAGRRARRSRQIAWLAAVAVLALSLVHIPAAQATGVELAQFLIEGVAPAPPKVAVIVGPVGPELTPVYIEIAEAAAIRAEERGATVARAYSPNATPENVLAAMADAAIVVYLGHGVGFPNPYSDASSPETTNGFGLQGPNARGDHSDSWQDGTLAYYGEAWLAANARPAPGWVMVYSNACYAPGASEGFDVQATPEVAAARVANYSRAPLTEMGASAYFATDFYMSAAELIDLMLSRPEATLGEIYAGESRFQADAVTRVAHPLAAGSEIWLQRSPYFEGRVDYWYSFAGNPNARLGALAAPTPTVVGDAWIAPSLADGVLTGMAASHPADPAWEAQPTAQLPLPYGAIGTAPQSVVICADRCARVLVVATCDCEAGQPAPLAVRLSPRAWLSVSDHPPDSSYIPVTVHLGASQPAAAVDAAAQP